MKRRQFIQLGSAAVLAALASPLSAAAGTIKTAADLHKYLRSLHPMPEPSVDQIIIGSPETEIKKIGACWMPYWKTLRQAVAEGVNVMVVHEPTFYYHREMNPKNPEYAQGCPEAKAAYLQAIDQKKQWLVENEMVIIRCHDVLDAVAGFGVPLAFARALDFAEEKLHNSNTYYRVYNIEPTPALKMAEYIVKQLKLFNQTGVEFYGDPDFQVTRVGIGAGCACNPIDFMNMGANFYVAIDDSIRTWIQAVYAEDTGIPLVVLHHGTSEENGVRLLSEHLQSACPQVPVIHFNQGCGYRWVTI